MIKEKRYILFLSPWYPDKKDPMPGLFVQRHAKAVSKHCQVHTLYVKSYKDQGHTEENWTADPIEELRIYPKFTSSKALTWFRYVKYYLKGFRKITKIWGQKPDIVHVNILTRVGAIALLYNLIWGVPYVITEHWTRYAYADRYTGLIRKMVTNLVVKRAKAIMPVTLDLAQSIEGAGVTLPKIVEVVPNVVDTNVFVPLKKNDGEKVRFVHVSCFIEKAKNVNAILRTLKRLLDKGYSFEMKLVGDGPDFSENVAYAKQLGLKAPYVIFTGLLTGNDLVATIQNANAHVLFSNWENLPVVNLECFSCGVPVISSDVGGIKEFFNDDLGVLIAPGNEDKLYDALEKILQRKLKFQASVIREYAVRHFSEPNIGKQIVSVYQKVLAQN